MRTHTTLLQTFNFQVNRVSLMKPFFNLVCSMLKFETVFDEKGSFQFNDIEFVFIA